MNMKIVGFECRSGSFVPDDGVNKGKTIDWANTIIYYLTISKKVLGFKPCSTKVKTKDLMEMLGLVRVDDLQFAVGKDYEFIFDMSEINPVLIGLEPVEDNLPFDESPENNKK